MTWKGNFICEQMGRTNGANKWGEQMGRTNGANKWSEYKENESK
jgi:hypothetical protein